MSKSRLALIAVVVLACEAGPVAPTHATPSAQASAHTQAVLSTQPTPTAAVSQPPTAGSAKSPPSGPGASHVGPVNRSPSPAPTVLASTLPTLPATKDGPVPADLQPSLLAAPEDYPPTFADGCNVSEGGTTSRGTCLYGRLGSTTTIALFGDSHAAFWFPAVEAFAQRQGWRLLNLTMSSCTPADLAVYNSIFKRIYTECTAWRKQAVARLIAVRPAVILITGTHGISPVDSAGDLIPGSAVATAWEAGMTRTIDALRPAGGLVILMADTPVSDVNPPVCLSAHPASVLACATPLAKALDPAWLAAEERVVGQTGVGFIDPTFWVCPSDPCPAVLGNLLVYQNAGHLTATFAAALTDVLGEAIKTQIAAHGGLTAPSAP